MDDDDAREGDEASELAALRVRAYSEAADIQADPAALARLIVLEERERVARTADAAIPSPASVTPDAAAAAHADVTPAASNVGAGNAASAPGQTVGVARLRAAKRRSLFVAASIGLIGLVALAWAQQITPAEPEAVPTFAPIAGAPAADLDDPATRGRVGAASAGDFTNFLDDLRDEVLAGADLRGRAGRIVREELLPYGGSNGWSSWAGPTTDDLLCLVVSDGRIAIVSCDTPENVASGGVSTVVTAGQADSRGDAGFAPGTRIRITLLPGSVSTEAYTDGR